jgi:hypothetical protein
MNKTSKTNINSARLVFCFEVYKKVNKKSVYLLMSVWFCKKNVFKVCSIY